MQRVGGEVLAAWPRLDPLVNNAGVARFMPFERVPPEELAAQVQLNLITPYLLTQHLPPALARRRRQS